MTHNHKRHKDGPTMIELFAAVAVIILFWFGFKFGMRSAAELLFDHQDEFWFGILKGVAGIICGFVPAGVLAGLFIYIDMVLRKKKQ